jgi:CRISPR/Cas system-associated exonuclease Cas4 (RecB family)
VGDESIEVVDYKVTSRRTSAEDLERDYQLNMYGYFARQDHPWARAVYGTHVYPPLQTRTTVRLSDDGMEEAVAKFEAVVEMIETDTRFDPRPGEHCAWCQHVGKCPAMQGVPAEQLRF